MKRDNLLGIVILVVGGGSLIGYFVYEPPLDDPWIGFSCEEFRDFEMSPEHEVLTQQQHFEFHQYFDPDYDKAASFVLDSELDC
jgi:hypothetical protein